MAVGSLLNIRFICMGKGRMKMLYFREREKNLLRRFVSEPQTKALAIYGRRRTGKTSLVLDFIAENQNKKILYYQCASQDYSSCLSDYLSSLESYFPDDTILSGLKSFKEVFQYLSKIGEKEIVFIIDEFPFLAKKREDTAAEFQWIIDHALNGNKLILMGSSLSFMKSQINDTEAPLYGRFDEIIEIRPFSFNEIRALFPDFEEAVDVYAQTGGVAQYVMFFKRYDNVKQATEDLFFNRDGRLFQEAANLLMQELRDISTYVSILRALAGGEKDSGQIAQKCGMDQRGVFGYLNKLTELEIVSQVVNPLSAKKKERRYKISDLFFRFNYTFIEPNLSMITSIGERARPFVLGEKYNEYLGFVYEEIIRSLCFEYALAGKFPFMPVVVGKWWGNICENGEWKESEIDVVAFNDSEIIIGECKYKSKKIGKKELDVLKSKSQFVPVKGRRITYLLASRSGFTEELKDLNQDVILLEKT